MCHKNTKTSKPNSNYSRNIFSNLQRSLILYCEAMLTAFAFFYLCYRLTHAWSALKPKQLSIFHELEDMIDPYRGFRNYNEQLKNRQLPILPYFGMHKLSHVMSHAYHIFLQCTSSHF